VKSGRFVTSGLPFGDPGGIVGRNDHAVGCRTRTQRDQIRFPGPGIEPAEFAGGLRGEPDAQRAFRERERRRAEGILVDSAVIAALEAL